MNEPKQPLQPSNHLSPEINRNIAASEIEGGVWLKDLTVGTVLHIRTRNTSYTLEVRSTPKADGVELLLSGHSRYCPEPRPVHIHGSTWGGSMLKVGFIGRGMHLEFTTDEHPGVIVTSTIQDITEVQ